MQHVQSGSNLKRSFGRGVLAVALGLFAFSCTDSGPTTTPVDRTLPTQDPLFGFNGPGNCMDDDNNAFGSGGPINCTSNDISIAETFVTSVNGAAFTPGDVLLCTPGETINLGITLRLEESAASSRQDVGIWVSSDKDSDAHFGQCNHYTIDVGAPAVNEADPDEQDACAGIAAQSFFDFPLTGPAIPALCPATGTQIVLGGCVAWNVPSDDAKIFCPDPTPPANDPSNGFRAASLPTNAAKCNCTPFTIDVVLAGQITITKDALPNNQQNFVYTTSGGGLSGFTLDDDAGAPGADATFSASKNFNNLNPNTGDPRVVTETVPAGWVITNIACTGATSSTVTISGSGGGGAGFDAGDNSVSIDLASGEHVQCTFENTMQASLDIEKISLGASGTFDYVGTGTGVPANFTRGPTTIGVQTVTAPITLNGANAGGDKYVQESAEAGFTLTNISCTADGATVVIGRGGSGAFVDGGSAGYEQGDNTVKVTLAPGSDPQCVFTNTADAKIDIEKISRGGFGAFNFTEDGACITGGFSRTTTAADLVTSTAEFTCSAPFTAQYVQETVPAGWEITSISCSGGTFVIGQGTGAGFVNGGGAGFNAGDNSVQITPTTGVTTACTFENTKSATLAIQKITRGAAGGPFDYVGTGAGVPANFQRTTASANTATSEAAFAISVPNLGIKYVEESPEAGWALTGISCTANGATIVIGRGGSGAFVNGGSAGYEQGDNTVQVNVAAGSTPTCTFENTKLATVDVEKISLGGTGVFPFVETGDCFSGLSRTTVTAGVATATAASECPIPPAYPYAQYVQETAPAGWALTLIECTGTGVVIGRGGSAAFVNGGSAGFESGDNTVQFTTAAGSTASCTFTNTKLGSLTIVKDAQNPATDPENFSFTASGAGTTSPFELDDDGEIIILSNQKSFSDLLPGSRTVTEGAETNWALTGISCTGQTASTVTFTGGNADPAFQAGDNAVNVNLAAGENVTCTFVNQRLAQLRVQKIVTGGGTQSFSFTRNPGGVSFNLTTGQINSSGFTLAPGTYRVCETLLAVAWATTATLDGAPVSPLINPDDPADLGTRCVDVSLAYGGDRIVVFTNNPPPGGDARTIGYWKNWSSCTGGKQWEKALERGDWDRTLDGNLPQTIGNLTLAGAPGANLPSPDCLEAVRILDKSDIVTDKKKAGDPAYNLAAQLLAAQLNYAAGAQVLPCVTNTITLANNLLVAINFTGTGDYKAIMSATQIANANTYAALLDSYNNNTLVCP